MSLQRTLLAMLAAVAATLALGPLLVPVPPLPDTVPPEQLADPDSRFLDVGGLRLHYKRLGTGKQAVLLLHGFASSTFSWREVMAPLSEDHTVVAYDRPSSGLTDRPLPGDGSGESPYGPRAQVRQLHRQRAGGVAGLDGQPALQDHLAGVHALVHEQRGHAGEGAAVPQDALHRRGAAVLGQQRAVQVDRAGARHRQQRRVQDRAEGDHGEQVGRQRRQPLPHLGGTHVGRLLHRQPQVQRRQRHLRRRQPPPAPARPVGLRDHGDDVAAARHRAQRRDGEGGRAHEHHARAAQSWPPGPVRSAGGRCPSGSSPRASASSERRRNCRLSGERRSTNSTPSRWSISCWMARAR